MEATDCAVTSRATCQTIRRHNPESRILVCVACPLLRAVTEFHAQINKCKVTVVPVSVLKFHLTDGWINGYEVNYA